MLTKENNMIIKPSSRQRIFVISANIDTPVRKIYKDINEPTYMELNHYLKKFIKGRFERVQVLFNGGYTSMFVDSEGALKGLPVNLLATSIYQANTIYKGQVPDYRTSCIWGDAVLFQNEVWQ